jgi:hypothetical protein
MKSDDDQSDKIFDEALMNAKGTRPSTSLSESFHRMNRLVNSFPFITSWFS